MGTERTTPLIYQRDGDAALVVASKGGADDPPAWYLNLQDDRSASIQIKAEVYDVKARDAEPSEKPEMWETMVAAWPDYDEYQRKTDREIPVVVLERS